MSSHIPVRFEHEILAHITGVSSSISAQLPLILGIVGKPGSGKTYMCEEIFVKHNIKIFSFSVGEFENASSGVPAERLRERYDAVVKYRDENHTLSVLMINDVDTGVGMWGSMHQYTVNFQQILGELMQIADPHIVNTKRAPIIFTGNDFTKLYQPLIRSGRLAPFPWEPSKCELEEMIKSIFDKVKDADIHVLIDELAAYNKLNERSTELSVSFYASLRRYAYSAFIHNQLKQGYTAQVITNRLKTYSIDDKLTFSQLLQFGKAEIDKLCEIEKPQLG
jgi:hypothetical protein